MTHSPTCTGCHECDPEMRAALSAFTKGDYVTYCRWLTKQHEKFRTAGARVEMRCGITYDNEEDSMTDYTPIDPYAPSLAKLRAATATPTSTFEDTYKAERLREIHAEHDAWAKKWAAEPAKPRLTAAEVARYTPPNPYPALDAMKANR